MCSSISLGVHWELVGNLLKIKIELFGFCFKPQRTSGPMDK